MNTGELLLRIYRGSMAFNDSPKHCDACDGPLGVTYYFDLDRDKPGRFCSKPCQSEGPHWITT